MYSSVLNSITFNVREIRPSYCSMFPDVGSIGIDTDLVGFLRNKKWKNLKIIVNPPFTAIMISRAIDNIRQIMKTVKP